MTNKIIYWISTGLISLMMFFSAYAYFSDPEIKANFDQIGYPGYFRVELAIAKIIGVLILLIPAIPKLVKEWAYAGFGITFISAFIAHSVNAHPVSVLIMPVIAMLLLVTSRMFYGKLQE